MVELVFRDDDNFTHCVPAVSRLVGCDDVDFVETPDCQWILNADTIGVLLIAAVLAIKNSIARKSYYVRGRFKANRLPRIQVAVRACFGCTYLVAATNSDACCTLPDSYFLNKRAGGKGVYLLSMTETAFSLLFTEIRTSMSPGQLS
jgi:hypothetical protein